MPKATSTNTTSPPPVISGQTAISITDTIGRLKEIASPSKNPDLELCAKAERYEDLIIRRDRLWKKACEYDQNGKRHRALADEAFIHRGEIKRLESEVADWPVKTILGAIAKISAAMIYIDPMGEGISKNGTQHQLSLAALIDAKALLEAVQ